MWAFSSLVGFEVGKAAEIEDVALAVHLDPPNLAGLASQMFFEAEAVWVPAVAICFGGGGDPDVGIE